MDVVSAHSKEGWLGWQAEGRSDSPAQASHGPIQNAFPFRDQTMRGFEKKKY